ncbi:MAG: proprotein convertase P-domain-containing protein, partial [Deltaproteobacteria bacterium]|nr:proprotein convertase P-domain-containing protein [Kofleriaceae bacterium]
ADVHAVARVAYVGAAALEKLRVWAPGWNAPAAATCLPALRAGMRACVETQLADGATIDDAMTTCTDGEALGPVFDAICAGPLGAPFCGGSFEAFYTTSVPPCAVDLAYELMPLCVTDADCGGAPLRCAGRPHDGSSQLGVCKDLRNLPGQSEPCSPTRACAAGLVCAGLTLWDEGLCVGAWMADTFVMDVPQLVPAGAGITSSTTAVVNGLATVPLDILVDVDVRGADPRRLRITLESPNGDRGLIWDGATGGDVIPSRIRPGAPGIPGDDAVNGGWKLEVTTIGAGTAGTLHRWSIYLTSQWD